MTVTVHLYREPDDGEEMTIDVECGVTPSRPGRLYGDPADCYPEEPTEVEILEATWAPGQRLSGDVALTPEEERVAEDRAIEQARDAADARAEDAAESRAEARRWFAEQRGSVALDVLIAGPVLAVLGLAAMALASLVRDALGVL